MKRLLVLALSALLVLTALAAWAQAEAYTARVTGGALHLREKPDQDARSLGRYKSGTQVIVLADGEVFCRVKAPDGQEGYMMKAYLTFENGLPPMEAVTPTPAPTPDPVRAGALARGIDPNKPMLALTFDDGPQPDTQIVLDALNRYGAKATFFVLGKNIAGNEEVLRHIAEGGHQIAAHSWSHPNFTGISESAVRSQMTRTMDKVLEVTGQQVTMMRPPYGALHRLSRRPVTELGLPVILWSVDSLDWKTRSTEKTVNTILAQARNGAIILCHDVWATTGRAMESVVPALMEKGYQLVTVAEMMSFRQEPLKPGWEYGFLDVSKIEPGLTPLPQTSPAPESGAAMP